jgi:hypothetical protein
VRFAGRYVAPANCLIEIVDIPGFALIATQRLQVNDRIAPVCR